MDSTRTDGSFHVLVIGGGLGGLCLAQGLKKGGVSVAVYEREAAPSDTTSEGYSLQINAHGNEALHACLPPELWNVYLATTGRPVAGICFASSQLRSLLSARWGEAHADWRVSRRQLRQMLLTGLGDVVQFGKAFVRYEHTPDNRVTAFFEDGTSASGDLLVGADGVNSKVRKQCVPDARVHDLQIAAVGAKYKLTADTAKRLADPLTRYMTIVLPPRGCGMFVTQFVSQKRGEGLASDLADHVFWALIARREKFSAAHDLRHRSATELQDTVLGMIHDWDPNLRRLVTESDPPSFTTIALQSAGAIPTWETTCVTVLGDAIHTMPPLQGLGGNTALRDAKQLCQTLLGFKRGQQDLLGGLRTYESEMRRYGDQAVAVSLRYTEMFVSDNRLKRAAFESVLKLADMVSPMKRRMFPGVV